MSVFDRLQLYQLTPSLELIFFSEEDYSWKRERNIYIYIYIERRERKREIEREVWRTIERTEEEELARTVLVWKESLPRRGNGRKL